MLSDDTDAGYKIQDTCDLQAVRIQGVEGRGFERTNKDQEYIFYKVFLIYYPLSILLT
jgi:hypothetical protein